MNIYAIKTNSGYYVSLNPSNQSYHQDSKIKTYKFDGTFPVDTFLPSWGFISQKPSKVTHEDSQPDTNFRFELIDVSLVSEKMPLVIPKSEAGELEEYEFVWKSKFEMFKSLYKMASDKQEPLEVEDDFELITVFEVDNIQPPPMFEYPVEPTWNSYRHERQPHNINRADIEHQDLDHIIFPSLVMHETTCKLSSQDTYNIVRQYIKENINPKVAEVTSDFAFCFTVKKKLTLAKPYTSQYKHKVRGKRQLQIKSEYHDTRLVSCFEMTHSPENYKGYTPIKGFEGENEVDLKEQIDAYLEEIINLINEPLVECSHCNGVGVIVNGKEEK